MKFTADDATRFGAGLVLSPAQAAEWAEKANRAFDEATVSGADVIEAERYAIRTATASFRSGALSEYKPEARRNKAFEVTLAEVNPSGDSMQLVLPTGYFFSDFYGELIFTRTFMDLMVKNYVDKALGETMPFLDTDHDRAAANAWLAGLEARDDGLYAKWDFTERGRQLVKDRIYRYYSAHFGEILRVTDGAVVFPVFYGAALTNSPVMKTMPEAHLSDSHGTHGDAEHNPGPNGAGERREDVMELNDVIAFATAAPDTDKAKIAFAVAPELSTLRTEVEGLRAANAQLSGQVTSLQAEKLAGRKAEVIGKALAEGRILPKDKESWEKRFDSAPDVIAEIVESLPAAVDLGERGKPGKADEVALTADEQAVAKAFGQTAEEYRAGKPAKKE